ncbi:MAG: Gfo/Idh/MocA family oxidoreductase, partial [Planctomycetota bacterium]
AKEVQDVTTQRLQTTRRRFLQLGAGALAAPYIVPASVFGKHAPSNRITMGCIGTGNQGLPILERFMKQPDCQILAVCDVNRGSYGYKEPDHLRGREPARDVVNEYYAKGAESGSYSGCDAYNDFRELLARDDIDAVTIVSPDHWHAVMTILAANAGKDMYTEKPLSLTIGQGRAMADAVRRNNCVLQTGTHERSNPTVRKACELVRSGYIGDVQRILTHVGENNKVGPGPGWTAMPVPEGFDYDLWLGPAPAVDYHDDRCLYRFRFNYDYSGGQITNFGAHSNDMAQWGLGMDESGPVEIEYIDAEYLPEGSLFNTALRTKFRARYANGVELVCQTNKPSVLCRFEGTDGVVQVENRGKNFLTEPTELADVEIKPEDAKLAISDNHQRDFLDAVKERRDPVSSVEAGHRSGSVCHLGNIAIAMETKLTWDPETERFTNEEANKYLHRELRKPWDLPELTGMQTASLSDRVRG